MEIKPYKLFFGLEKEAFRADIGADEILQTPELTGAQSRFEYATDLGAAYLITDVLYDDTARISGFGEGSVLKLSRPALSPAPPGVPRTDVERLMGLLTRLC